MGTDTNSIKLLPDNIYYLKTSYSNNGYTNLDVITLKEYPGGMYIYDHYKICNLPDTVKNIIESGNSPASIIISGKVFVGDWSHQHSHDHIENFYNLELTSIRWGGDDEPH